MYSRQSILNYLQGFKKINPRPAITKLGVQWFRQTPFFSVMLYYHISIAIWLRCPQTCSVHAINTIWFRKLAQISMLRVSIVI